MKLIDELEQLLPGLGYIPYHQHDGEVWKGLKRVDEAFKRPSHLPEELQKLEADRGTFYGDPEISHFSIGLATAGILFNRYQWLYEACWSNGVDPAQFVPAELQALLFAGFKEVRAARPTFRADSYEDATVYTDFSRRWREGRPRRGFFTPKEGSSLGRGAGVATSYYQDRDFAPGRSIAGEAVNKDPFRPRGDETESERAFNKGAAHAKNYGLESSLAREMDSEQCEALDKDIRKGQSEEAFFGVDPNLPTNALNVDQVRDSQDYQAPISQTFDQMRSRLEQLESENGDLHKKVERIVKVLEDAKQHKAAKVVERRKAPGRAPQAGELFNPERRPRLVKKRKK